MPKRDPAKGWTPKPYRLPNRPNTYRVRVGGVPKYFSGPNALAEAHQWIATWIAAGGVAIPTAPRTHEPTVSELIAAFMTYAETKYMKFGKPTSEIRSYRTALRILRRLFGERPVTDFGPDALRTLQMEFVRQWTAWKCCDCGWESPVPGVDCPRCKHKLAGDRTWSRNHVNEQIRRVRRVFRWGLSRNFTPPGVLERLMAVESLREGDTTAPESEEIDTVPWEIVERTIAHVPQVIRDMVTLQRYTGMRPGEVYRMRPCDIDQSQEEWLYRPPMHKTQHRPVAGRRRKRKVWLGPKAQAILTPYLAVAPNQESLLFTGRDGQGFNKDSYLQALRRGWKRAGLTKAEQWCPSRLRKTLATEAEERYNLEHAKAALGHSKSRVTSEHYSRADDKMARKVARELG